MSRRVVASAPGKVNLVLWSGPPDAQGYHPLYSIFETLRMRETVTLTPQSRKCSDARSARGVSIRTVVNVADPDTNMRLATEINSLNPQRNLAWRAVDSIRRYVEDNGGRPPGAAITVHKTIPIAGGMAGGSADAAAALVAANEFYQANMSEYALQEIARSLGADVPTCVIGGLNVGFGYGDYVTRLDSGVTPTHHWVMVLAHEGLSTPAVFEEFDKRGRGRSPLPEFLLQMHSRVAEADAAELADMLDNDLEGISRLMRADLDATFHAIEQTDAVGAILSGSGPTIAVLARDEEHALKISHLLEREPSVAATIVTAGPGQAARLEDV